MTLKINDLKAVVLPINHSPSQDYAADELIRYIDESTGVKLKKLVQDGDLPPNCIILGNHPKIKQARPEISVESLGDEGFWLDSTGDQLIIAGSDVRGTLYGVYTFLEEVLGIKFLYPEIDNVPKVSPDTTIPDISRKSLPDFGYRVITYLDGMDPEWTPTQKINLNPFAEPEMGGSYKFSTTKMTHTFYKLIPPGKYYKDHPEYFSLVNGERLQALGQPCLTHPDVIKIATDTVLEWFKEEPDIMTVGIVQNDWTGYCECEKCKAVDKGNPARSLIKFCKHIADEVKKEWPDKFIHTIAYTYTEEPPMDMKGEIPDNMIVVLCNMYPYRSNRPMDKDPMNKSYFDHLLGWLEIAPHVFVWHYFVDFTHYFLPYPIWKTMHADLKKYKEVGVEGVLLQAGIGLGLYQEFQELKMWVFHKLMWDTNLDLNTLIKEFIDAYYGKAAPVVQNYVDAIMALEDKEDVCLHLYVGLEGNHIKKDWVLEWMEALEGALDLVKDDKALVERVEKVILMLDYSYLILPVEYDIVLGKITPKDLKFRKKVLDRILDVTNRYKIGSPGENAPVKAFLDRQKFICQENSMLAVAELAPVVYKTMEALLGKVKTAVDKDGFFKPNNFITSALKSGLHPIELSPWMSEKGVAIHNPKTPDIWHHWLNLESINKMLDPRLPNVRKSDLPAVVHGMIKGLPDQADTLED
ncbi:MAG: DUF4838 domain-containing protein [Candidatus Hodarchaeota archaeon]